MKYSQELIDHFIFEEGLRLHSYKDTEGYWTIGVGRMLGKESKYANIKITREQAMKMLEADITESYVTCRKLILDYNTHPTAVQLAVLDMAFNLGYPKLSKFVKTLGFIRERKYTLAADEALRSKWARQLPNRAARVSGLLRSVGC